MATKKAKVANKAATATKTKAVARVEHTQIGLKMTPEQVELIKKTVAKDATDDELALFLYQANRTGLDPLAKQIHFVKRGGQGVIQTGIDGFRAVAERSGTYAGQGKPEYQYSSKQPPLPSGKAYPAVAIVTVFRFNPKSGERYPAGVGEAHWREYAPVGSQAFMWHKMPHTMLSKCAEAIALRKAFPQDLSGLYSDEEMAQAGLPAKAAPVATTAPQPAPKAQEGEIVPDEVKPAAEPASAVSLRQIAALGVSAGLTREVVARSLCLAYKVKSVMELTQDQADDAIARLKAKISGGKQS